MLLTELNLYWTQNVLLNIIQHSNPEENSNKHQSPHHPSYSLMCNFFLQTYILGIYQMFKPSRNLKTRGSP